MPLKYFNSTILNWTQHGISPVNKWKGVKSNEWQRECERDGKNQKKRKSERKRNSRITPIKYTWRANESSTFLLKLLIFVHFIFTDALKQHKSEHATKKCYYYSYSDEREAAKPSARDVMHGDSQKLKLYDYFDIVHHKLLAPIINLNGSYSKAFLSRRYQITPPQIHLKVCERRNCM